MTEAPRKNYNRHTIKHHGTLGAQADGSKPSFGQAPTSLARARISASARSTAFYLWSHTDGWATSAEAIATDIGTTAKTVRGALDVLEAAGWLVRQPTGVHNQWVLHLQRSNIPFSEDEVRVLSGPVETTGDPERPPVETTDAPPVEITGPPPVETTELRVQVRLQEDSSSASRVSEPAGDRQGSGGEKGINPVDTPDDPKFHTSYRRWLDGMNPKMDPIEAQERALSLAHTDYAGHLKMEERIAEGERKRQQRWDAMPRWVTGDLKDLATSKGYARELPDRVDGITAMGSRVYSKGAYLRKILTELPDISNAPLHQCD